MLHVPREARENSAFGAKAESRHAACAAMSSPTMRTLSAHSGATFEAGGTGLPHGEHLEGAGRHRPARPRSGPWRRRRSGDSSSWSTEPRTCLPRSALLVENVGGDDAIMMRSFGFAAAAVNPDPRLHVLESTEDGDDK